MPERTLIAILRPVEDNPGSVIVASPVVGLLDHRPRMGNVLNPLDTIATIRILHESHVLRMPREAHGRIVEVFVPDAVTPVAYNDPIVRIEAIHQSVREEGPPSAGASSGKPGVGSGTVPNRGPAGEPEVEGWITVVSPTVGIFYRRPSPEAAPFVQVGSTVTTGSVLGLVEVMKSFNQITYGGPGLPERGEVTEVAAGDNVEVDFGQLLFRIRPLSS